MVRFRDFLVCSILFWAMVLIGSPAVADGPEFTALGRPQPTESPGKVEVIEFFWYGCPHCNKLEPAVEAWEKKLPGDVVLRREHVIWGGRKEIEVHARLFLTLRSMNLLEPYHRAAFDAIHKDKLGLRDETQVLAWAAKQGIDGARFAATYKSFGVAAEVVRTRSRTRDYGVDGVPSFVVNGKYMTSLASAHGEERLFAILDKLIAQERRSR